MSEKIEFDYFPHPKRDPKTKVLREEYYPLISTRISYGHALGRNFLALVDSGSDFNLFQQFLGKG
ncbi:hypothetical protein A3A66_01910 [Microgenomates group bacterium RIFCSPLOWO2_01_FULL_46_13]|nr:MAG: hypothetical protein A3A66_01910 [Microgenomates group bacterium RIFCSPLOWO2_01_FULL_46_13]